MIPGLPRSHSTAGTGTDTRRQSSRYELITTVQYRLADSGRAIWRKGRTLDMSANGIRLEIEDTMAPDCIMELVLDWTGLYHDRRGVQLWVRGRVVRSGPAGTAVRIVEHEFRAAGVPIASSSRRAKARLAVA